MSGSAKRLWSPNLSFEEVNKLILNFLIRCREKNILIQKPTNVYKVYKFEQSWSVEGMAELSKYLRFSKNDTPETDRTRDSLIRLLSVLLKAHFFTHENAKVRNEPYVFCVPDLSKANSMQYGIIYQIEEDNKLYTMVIADWDMMLSNSNHLKTTKSTELSFTLSHNSFKWLEVKKWREYKKAITDDNIYKLSDFNSRKSYFAKVNQERDIENFSFGTIIKYSPEIKDFLSYAGAEWAIGVKSWFIPNGLDVLNMKEYFDYIEKLTPEERYALKWWTKNKFTEKVDYK